MFYSYGAMYSFMIHLPIRLTNYGHIHLLSYRCGIYSFIYYHNHNYHYQHHYYDYYHRETKEIKMNRLVHSCVYFPVIYSSIYLTMSIRSDICLLSPIPSLFIYFSIDSFIYSPSYLDIILSIDPYGRLPIVYIFIVLTM